MKTGITFLRKKTCCPIIGRNISPIFYQNIFQIVASTLNGGEMYPENNTYIAKFWFYCSIAGCSLDSSAQLFKNLINQNKNTSIKHYRSV